MEHGAVTDWEAMERVWQAAFSQLRVSAADQPVLMTEPLLNPTANRENMTQVGVAATLTNKHSKVKQDDAHAQIQTRRYPHGHKQTHTHIHANARARPKHTFTHTVQYN